MYLPKNYRTKDLPHLLVTSISDAIKPVSQVRKSMALSFQFK